MSQAEFIVPIDLMDTKSPLISVVDKEMNFMDTLGGLSLTDSNWRIEIPMLGLIGILDTKWFYFTIFDNHETPS